MAKKTSKVAVKKAPKAAKKTAATTPAERETREETPAWYHPIEALRRDVDEAFERFGRGWPRWPGFGRSLFDYEPFRELPASLGWGRAEPRSDVVETDKAYTITAELPGMDENDVELTLRDGFLTLKGEKRSEREEKDEGYHLSERTYGSIQRSFRVPEDVDVDKVDAAFANGVLTVTLPKSTKAKTKERKIAVKAK